MDPHSITIGSIMNSPDKPLAQPAPAPAKRSFSEFAQDNTLPSPRLVLLHADTIIDGRKALTYTIAKVISIVRPKTKRPTDDEILATVRRTPNLTEVYHSLGAVADNATEAREWCLRHRNVMKRARPKLLGVYPEAEPFLQCLHAHRIPALLLTSALDKVEAVGKDWSFKHLIAGSVGDAHTFLENKEQFANVIKTVLSPWVAKHDLASDEPLDMTKCDKYESAPLRPEEIMVVSCCEYNLVAAQQLGIQTCWIRMGDASVREGRDTESVVDNLDGLAKIIKECEPKKKIEKSTSKITNQMDSADEAGPSNTNDQEGAEEASAGPVNETQQETTESHVSQVIKSPLVKSEPDGSAEPVEEMQTLVKCEPEGSPETVKEMQTATLDDDVVMLDAADGEEEPAITITKAVKNVAAGDQPNDTVALYDYVTGNDAAPNDAEETEAHKQSNSWYEDGQQSPKSPEAPGSSPKQVFSSPQIPSSQTTTFLEQMPSSPPAITSHADNFSEQLELINEGKAASRDNDNQTQDNNQMSNATMNTDSTLSDVPFDLSD